MEEESNCILCDFCKESQYIDYVFVITREQFIQIEALKCKVCQDIELYPGVPTVNFIKFSQKYNFQSLRQIFRFIGCKAQDSGHITEQIFRNIADLIQLSEKQQLHHSSNQNSPINVISHNIENSYEFYKMYSVLTITKELFDSIIEDVLKKFEYQNKLHMYDFEIASKIFTKELSVVILLGGTSGTGKSTLSSLLASRLGISVNLSTDSIRHIMRNFISKESNPILFASTYEAGQLIENQNLRPKQAVIKGWQYQCDTVFSNLRAVIHKLQQQQQSMIIEGVHLSVHVMKKLMKEFKNIIPFVILITNESKHKEHFAVRSKFMTMDPKVNKYIQYFQNIRTIHKRFQKSADEILIPKVDNSNVDRTVGLIHGVVLRVLRRIYQGEQTYDKSRKQSIMVYNEFMDITQNIRKQSKVKQLIKQRVSKGELFQRYFEQKDQQFEANSSIPKEEQKQEHQQIDLQKGKSFKLIEELENQRKKEIQIVERSQEESIQSQRIKWVNESVNKYNSFNEIFEKPKIEKKSACNSQNSPKTPGSPSIKSGAPSTYSHEDSLVSGSILLRHMVKTVGRSSKRSSMSEIDSLRVEEDISSNPEDSKTDSDVNVNEMEIDEDEIYPLQSFENAQEMEENQQNWHGRQQEIQRNAMIEAASHNEQEKITNQNQDM